MNRFPPGCSALLCNRVQCRSAAPARLVCRQAGSHEMIIINPYHKGTKTLKIDGFVKSDYTCHPEGSDLSGVTKCRWKRRRISDLPALREQAGENPKEILSHRGPQ